VIGELFKPQNFLFLANGLITTIYLSIMTIIWSVAIGTVLGIARTTGQKWMQYLVGGYIEIVRNIPMLLWIFGVRFLSGLRPFQSVIVAMTIFTSAMVAEIVRGGLNSVKKGQWEAAKSQGFKYHQILIFIILPQAFKSILPALISQMITIIKDTSFVWMVGIEELTGKGRILMGRYGNSTQVFLIFGMIALTYFILNEILSVLAARQERKTVHHHI
jgi:putative glutamine transport system permease protein